MKQIILYCTLSVFVLVSCQNNKKESIPASPNIILFLADDMGYADLGCYGSNIRTPHINELAEKGLRFTNFYAAAPNCSPSRAAILTGRFSARVGIYSYIPGWADHVMHLKDEEITIAELLKQKGYQTAHFGKWHLGCLPQDSSLNQPQPADQGFDYSLGTENNASPTHKNPVNFIRNGRPLGKMNGYSCQIVADEVSRWYNKRYQPGKPFFHCIWYHEPHKKVASPEELVRNYPDVPAKTAEYFANIENLDSATGRVLDELRQRGLMDQSLIIFTSDNGPYRQGSQGNLRGLKGEVYEGGIKVPGIMYWQHQITGPRTIEQPAGFVDILPTITDICNIDIPAELTLDGESLLPLLSGKKWTRKKPLFCFFYRTYPEAAIRFGKYNMVGYTDDKEPRTHYFSAKDMDFIKQARLQRFELYDLEKDPGQQHNILANHPMLADSLKILFKKHFQEIISDGPTWEGLIESKPEDTRPKTRYRRK